MSRILILGCPGSGKSTLARRLAARTGLPVVHLDQLYWTSGWVEPSREDWFERVEHQMSAPEWILDGNYGNTLERRLQVADEVILLDLPVSLCLWRVLYRAAVGWGKTRPDMAEGCPERFDLAFFLYVWRFRRNQLPRTMRLLARFRRRVTILRSVQKIESFADSYSSLTEGRK